MKNNLSIWSLNRKNIHIVAQSEDDARTIASANGLHFQNTDSIVKLNPNENLTMYFENEVPLGLTADPRNFPCVCKESCTCDITVTKNVCEWVDYLDDGYVIQKYN